MAKIVYQSVKVCKCEHCKSNTKHKLIDYTLQIFKCSKCGNILTKL